MIEPLHGARLTLLAIRSGIPSHLAFAPDVIQLGHRGPVVSIEAAVQNLAERPKPLGCFVEVRNGVCVLNFPSLPAPFLARGDSLTGEWYREQYGADYRGLSILCLGRFDWTILTMGEFESWESAYPFLGNIGFSVTKLAAARRVPPDALETARSRGVVQVHDYRPPDVGGPVATRGPLAIARLALVDGSRLCERCDERPARFTIRWYFGDHAPRTLCQRCIDEELSTGEFDEGRQLDRDEADLAVLEQSASADELARVAQEYAMRWALRTKPPFMQTFIDRYQR